jgi:type III secretion protein O
MARYPLAPLLSVRQYREETAQNLLRQAERMAREAEATLREREKELERYRIWRVEEEDRRYEAIMGQLLSLGDLEAFKAGLGRLRDAELLREEDVAKAEQALAKAHQAVTDARNGLNKARRDTARILAHKNIWNEMTRREAERKEDLESEEFRPLPIGTGDDA